MILASHQPDFVPYMGFFKKLYMADVFVLSDSVQFSKSGRHNWNSIRNSRGSKKITIPVHASSTDLIMNVLIANESGAMEDMLKTIETFYRKSPYFDSVFPDISRLFTPPFGTLAQFNTRFIRFFAKQFKMKAIILLSSELGLKKRKDERIIEMCQLLGTDTYLSGEGAKDYHVEQLYKDAGVKLKYLGYRAIDYDQFNSNGTMICNLSVLDYVFNNGYQIPDEWR